MNLEKFLKDFSYNSKYEFLEESGSELATVAAKSRIKLPAHDLAPFKCIYAFVEKENLNGCTLPRKEVEKALDTLVGKAIDFDHLRKQVVGYWIDAQLEDDIIVAYGVFFKGNFQEDYGMIKELMEKDVLAISFEAYGNREFTGTGSYNLTDIEFSGGALLIKTSPAFPGSEVLEMSKQNKVLEFAKVMTPPNKFFYGKDDEVIEKAKLVFEDIPTVYELISGIECPTCKNKGGYSIDMIDLEKKELRVNCYGCGAKLKMDLTPTFALIKKGKKPEIMDSPIEYKGESKVEVKELVEFAKKLDLDISKIDLEREDAIQSLTSLIKDTSGERLVKCNYCSWQGKTDKLAKSTKCPQCGHSVELLSDKGNTDGGEDMEKIKELETEIASLKEEATKRDEDLLKKTEELEKATATIEEMKKESEEAKVKIEEIEKAKSEEIAKAKEEATKLAERKSELGETELSDEDILDDSKFENAKLKKQLADKEAEIAKLKETSATKDLDKGSSDKDVGDEITKKANRVREIAYGKE